MLNNVTDKENEVMDMTVTLHAKEIRVLVAEGSLNHLILKNFIDRYFSSVMRLRGSIIIMHNESELSQKKYFIQWLYAAYQKKRSDITPKFLKALQSAIAFPIFISAVGSQKPARSIIAKIRVLNADSSIVSITIEPKNSLAVNFFHFRFSKYVLRKNEASIEIKISEESLAILSELLARDRVLAQPIIYQYDKIQIDRLRSILSGDQKQNEKQRFYRLVFEEDRKLSEAYKTLGVSSGADNDSLKQTYRKLALRCHPDRAFSQGKAAVAEMTRKFHAINDAYSLIMESRTAAS